MIINRGEITVKTCKVLFNLSVNWSSRKMGYVLSIILNQMWANNKLKLLVKYLAYLKKIPKIYLFLKSNWYF